MPYLVGVETVFPENYYPQSVLIEGIRALWQDKVTNFDRIENIHKNVQVDHRHLAVPLEQLLSFKTFKEKNDAFTFQAGILIHQAVSQLLQKNHLAPFDIQSLWSNTITGLSVPSLEARLMNQMDFLSHTKRIPIFGLGCMAGVAGINRVCDYLLGHPSEAAIFFSVELCSLTFQTDDVNAANIVSTGLFGDGCAAVLLVGDQHPLAPTAPLKFSTGHSIFFKESEDVMGWEFSEKGLSILLSKSVPEFTLEKLSGPFLKFLSQQNLSLATLKHFVAHPGGPKVLLAIEQLLDLPAGGLVHSWNSLKANGNMSSVSVLDIFNRTLHEAKNKKPLKNDFLLSLAMGPGFSAEIGLFQWN